jgi:hypothetical protein
MANQASRARNRRRRVALLCNSIKSEPIGFAMVLPHQMIANQAKTANARKNDGFPPKSSCRLRYHA